MFPEDDELRAKILTHHLHNLERRNYQAIARDLGTSTSRTWSSTTG